MRDLLVLGTAVALVPGVRLVLVRLRRGRWSGPSVPNEFLPPPAGHHAVAAAGGRTIGCSCGWWYAVPWPPTSRRLNRARSDHCAAVEQERLAKRLGVDAESMLDRVLTARGNAGQAQEAARPELGQVVAQIGTGSERPRRPEPTRSTRRAAQARRASATARVEAGRVLPKYTSGDG